MPVNPILMQQVKAAMASKLAFVTPGAGAPPGGAPPMDPAAAGGAPPMDPAMMGGAPGGAPPMDPSMMGGAPPMDPAMMGGAPPMDPSMMGGAPPMDPAMMGGAPPMDPSMMGGAPPAPAPGGGGDDIRQLIRQEIQQAMSQTMAGGDAAKAKGKGAGKIDPAQMIEYMDRQQKLLINLYESLGLNLPYNILDKPSSGEEGGDQQQPAKDKGTDTNVSGIPPIKPIEPIGGKQASVRDQAQALRYLMAAANRKV